MPSKNTSLLFDIILFVMSLIAFALLSSLVYAYTNLSTGFVVFIICTCTLIIVLRQQKILNLLKHMQDNDNGDSEKK